MTKKEKLRYCSGCQDNFYNGNNPHGIQECWCLKDAKVVWKKEVHIDQRPPWDQKAKRVLSCYRKPRHIYVDPKRRF